MKRKFILFLIFFEIDNIDYIRIIFNFNLITSLNLNGLIFSSYYFFFNRDYYILIPVI
jgi:hypothetical protein